MEFKCCSRCDILTDSDQEKCPSCGEESLEGKNISLEELVCLIQAGKIRTNQIWTKHVERVREALGPALTRVPP